MLHWVGGVSALLGRAVSQLRGLRGSAATAIAIRGLRGPSQFLHLCVSRRSRRRFGLRFSSPAAPQPQSISSGQQPPLRSQPSSRAPGPRSSPLLSPRSPAAAEIAPRGLRGPCQFRRLYASRRSRKWCGLCRSSPVAPRPPSCTAGQ
ncbi:hypothetical protein NDU88_002683 [Pleurodeles waltl]|uniref:Uncharacterized protein n=1 Tax=Pleurodeles waltl TaxID=8319 RepID=A0AAV7LD65_PLEWA|nr:hypothetical protein NDU88_002683 [Pleurodeles waltl]